MSGFLRFLRKLFTLDFGSPAGDGPLVRTGQGDYTRDWPEGDR